MTWIAFAKVVSSVGTSPGPASSIRYIIRYNDPETGVPVTTLDPIRPWNPIELAPNGDEMDAMALAPGSPMLAINVGGILQFVAFGPAEPRAYVDCGTTGANLGGFVPPPNIKLPIVLPPPPPPPGGISGVQSAPDTGGDGNV